MTRRNIFASTQKPRARGSLSLVRNESDDSAELLIYDEISFWGINAEQFARDMRALDVSTIHVRINSPGGSVFDGVAIANALRAHDAKVVTHIDSLAASIASIIAIAGDEVRMSDNAFFMIHDPWTITAGNARQLRNDADLLDKIGDSLINDYVKRTGAERDDVLAWMQAETWFSAQEALDENFIDFIDGASSKKNRVDISKYNFKSAPAALMEDVTEEAPTVRTVERALRTAGLSRNEARRVALAAFSPAQPHTENQCDAEIRDALSGLENLAAVFTK